MGQVVQGGAGQAPARQAAINGGVPPEAACMTINKVCGSGLKAVCWRPSRFGRGPARGGGRRHGIDVAHAVCAARRKTGFKFGHQKLDDIMISDGLWCAFKDWHMGSAAELTGRKAGIGRDEQDEFACNSHKKAVAAQQAREVQRGNFRCRDSAAERGSGHFQQGRMSSRRRSRSKLSASCSPAFEKDGTVTAGNAPGLNDGSAATVVVSDQYLKEKGLKPLARVVDYAMAGTPPELLFFSPIYAVQKLMKKMNVTIDHWDLIEANEAFSVQALADGKELGWDWSRVNVHGGAVALGHPIGASGTRILTTLIYALKDRGKKNGLATLCLGGGNAVALAIELV